METITIKITNGDARLWAAILRDRYSKDKRTGLARLAEIAIRREVLDQLFQNCYAAEALLAAEQELIPAPGDSPGKEMRR